MVFEELAASDEHWSILQQPAHASNGVNPPFRALLAAVDQGWLVEEPVQVLPSARNNSWIYYFVLTHPALSQVCRLFVPALPEVERYVERSGYSVIEGSYY